MSNPNFPYDIRKADQRGVTEIGWLHSHHSFSFGRYRDPDRMGFGPLRVLNDDVVSPGGGFGEHGHNNMEIISWVLAGDLAHADSEGHRGVIRPGEAQVMSAGSGIRHSEMNGSDSAPVHFIQVWIEPSVMNVPPRYEDRTFDAAGRAGQWQPIASGDGHDGSLPIHRDATMSVADLLVDDQLEATVAQGRRGYLHLATGAVRVDGQDLQAGDAIATTQPITLSITATADSQLLWFDLD